MNILLIGGIPLIPAGIGYLLWTYSAEQIRRLYSNTRKAITIILTIHGLTNYIPKLLKGLIKDDTYTSAESESNIILGFRNISLIKKF